MSEADEVMLKQCTLKVAFIVADDTALDGDTELHIYNSINGRIASIDLYHEDDIDAGSANLEKYNLVVVSDKVTYSKVDELTTLRVPIISFNGDVSNNVLHIGTSNDSTTVTETNITDETHNITREQVKANNQKIYNPGGGGPVEYIGGISSEAISLTQDPTTSTQKHLVVIDRNRLLTTEEKAPELRLHFGFTEKNKLTNLGKTLYSESIMYGLCGRGPMEIDIQQVSERIESYKNIPVIALIVGDKTSLDADTETFFKNRLEEDYIVHVYDDGDIDNGTANLDAYDLIIVSQQVTDANLDELTALERPVLSMKGSVSADKLHIGSTSGNNASQTQIKITDNTHNITRDQSTTTQDVYSSASGIDYIGSIGSGGIDLAENPTDSTDKYLAVIDEGKRLADDNKAPDHRIHFGLYQGNQLNDLGLVLFDEAVIYGLFGAKRIDFNIEVDVDQILPAVSYKSVPEVGFIVADKSNLNASTEEAFYIRLSEISNVTLIDDDDVDSGNMDLKKLNAIIVSHEVDQTKLDVELPILRIPIMSMKGEVSDDILKIGTTNGESSNETESNIEDNTHNITTGETTGPITIYNNLTSMDYIGSVSSDTVVLARDVGTAAEKHLVVVNKFRLLADNTRAPERRIHFAFFNGSYLTDTGWRLFNNSLEYLFRGYYQEIDVISRGSRIFGIFKGVTPVGKTPGNVYFVDYNNGNDNNDGLTIATTKKTITSALSLCRNNKNDTVLVLRGDYNNEEITVNVDGVHILGLGADQCKGMAFKVTANHVEIAGFTTDHSSAASDYACIMVTGNYAWVHDNDIGGDSGTTYNGIRGYNADRCIIENNIVRNNTMHGIALDNGSSFNIIRNNIIYNQGANGIEIGQSDCNRNIICSNYIWDNGAYGIDTTGNNLFYNNVLKNNAYGAINIITSTSRFINNYGVVINGSHLRGPGDTTTEKDILTNIDVPRVGLCAIKFNVSDFSTGGTIILRVEDTSGDVWGKVSFVVGTDEVNPTIEFWTDSGHDKFDITIQTTATVTIGGHTLEYEIIFGDG